jgi:hypothetical protein
VPRTVRALGPALGLVLTLAGLLVVVEAAGSLAGADHVLVDWRGLRDGAGSGSWSSPSVRLVCLLVTVLGAVLVVLALRGSRAEVTLRTGDPALAGTTSRRAVARIVGAAVRAADGVSGAVDVVVGRSTVTVRVTRSGLDGNHPGTLTERVRAAAATALDTLPLQRTPTVEVTERTPGNAPTPEARAVTTPEPDDPRPADPAEPAPSPAPDPVTPAAPGPAAARARSVRTSRLRAERLRLATVGGVLAVLGVLGLLLGTGPLGDGGPVADPDLVSRAGRTPVLSAIVAALVGVVLAGLGGLWLVRSLRRTSAPDLTLAVPEGWGDGTVLVRGAALAEAARTDAEQVPGVAQARARLLGTAAAPVLVLDLVLHRGADLGTVLQGVEQQVLVAARTTVERDELPTAVHVEVEASPGAGATTARVC